MTSGVVCDVVHRLYEGIFILPQFHASLYTYLYVIKKNTPFPASIFMKLISDQQNYVQMLYTEF